MRRVILVILFVAFSRAADATTVMPLTSKSSSTNRRRSFYGRVSDVRSAVDRRSALHRQRRVDRRHHEGLKGGRGETIAFTVPGGQVGRYLNVIPGAPIFAPGDLAVFFLTVAGPAAAGDHRTHAGRLPRAAWRGGGLVVVPPLTTGPGGARRSSQAQASAAIEDAVRA